MTRLLLILAVCLLLPAPAEAAFTARAGAGATLTAAAVFPPRLVEAPTITGAARAGSVLTVSEGVWARGRVTVTVRWERCDDSGCEIVPGAIARTVTVGAADVGRRLRAHVTARNEGGDRTVVTEATAVVVAAAPVSQVAPSIAGPTAVGDTLEVDGGTWSGSPALSFRWLRCAAATCSPVDTGTRYVLEGADAGSTLKVEVTATGAGGSTTVTTAPTAVVGRRTYTYVLCANPDTGLGVALDEQLPDGLRLEADAPSFDQTVLGTRCAQGVPIQGLRGVPLRIAAAHVTSTPHWGGMLRYRAPADTSLTGATLFRHATLTRTPGARFDVAVQRHPDPRFVFGTPSDERCLWQDGCASLGSATPFAPPNRVSIGPATSQVNGFNVALTCNIPDPSWTCTASGAETYRIFGGQITLRDEHTPAVTNATGSLLTDATLTGTQQLTLTATDRGAGVFRARVRLDGADVATAPLAPSVASCRDVNPANADPYEFARHAPCPASTTATLGVDTAGWPRGEHELRVVVEDAGGNTVTVQRRTVTVA